MWVKLECLLVKFGGEHHILDTYGTHSKCLHHNTMTCSFVYVMQICMRAQHLSRKRPLVDCWVVDPCKWRAVTIHKPYICCYCCAVNRHGPFWMAIKPEKSEALWALAPHIPLGLRWAKFNCSDDGARSRSLAELRSHTEYIVRRDRKIHPKYMSKNDASINVRRFYEARWFLQHKHFSQ